MGKGFLGTDASLMMDVVVCSLALVVPVLIWSIDLVKRRKKYLAHKRVQVILFVTILTVVTLFEVDMRLSGGFWKMAKDSPYAQTSFLHRLLAVHLFFSISNVLVWITTFTTAVYNFPNPPRPGAFSRPHKILAWTAVIDMVATAVTGLMVYYYGFLTKG